MLQAGIVFIAGGTAVGLFVSSLAKVRVPSVELCCINNIKNLNLALLNYEAMRRELPPFAELPPDGSPAPWSLHARLLPYLQRDDLYQKIDFARGVGVQPDAADERVAPFICPADAASDSGAPTNYAASLGTWLIYDPVSKKRSGDGVFSINSISLRHNVKDGISDTIAFAEVAVGTLILTGVGTAEPPRNPNDLSLHGWATAPDAGHRHWARGEPSQTGATMTFPPNTGESDFVNHPLAEPTPTYAAVTSRSRHRGGVNIGLLDGSARFVPNRIERSVWRALGTRAGGEPISSDW